MPAAKSGASSSQAQPPDEPRTVSAAKQTSHARHWWSAPWRWLKRTAATVVRPFKALISSPFRLAKAIFMATIGRDRGFGFWWLVATLALALVIGLLLGIVLSPVLGLLAAIGVALWMLARRSRSDSDSPSRAEPSSAART